MPAKKVPIPEIVLFLSILVFSVIMLPLIPGCSYPQYRETSAETEQAGVIRESENKEKEVAETEIAPQVPAISNSGVIETGSNKNNGDENPEISQTDVPEAGQTKEGRFPPNELGEIMILMYHEIGRPEGEWRRTPENFRRDLQTLYDGDYRLVHLDDVVRGEINVPKGTTPVVLTFDDGNRGNFYYLKSPEGHELDPDCAVAILEEFNTAYPGFGVAATFYINYPNPFRQPEYTREKLNYLVEKGFAIGNHTYGHADLSRLSPGEIQREIALHQQYTEKYVPGYTVNSLALPYGAYPRGHADLLMEGTYDGTTYRNLAVLLVGANPAKSPFHRDFNPARLPRIRASELNTAGVGLYEWLAVFENNPQRRYVSDGNTRVVTVPPAMLDSLDKDRIGVMEVITYSGEN